MSQPLIYLHSVVTRQKHWSCLFTEEGKKGGTHSAPFCFTALLHLRETSFETQITHGDMYFVSTCACGEGCDVFLWSGEGFFSLFGMTSRTLALVFYVKEGFFSSGKKMCVGLHARGIG